jgi:hypothetical protein
MAKDVRRKNFRQTKQGKLKEIKSAKNRIKHSRVPPLYRQRPSLQKNKKYSKHSRKGQETQECESRDPRVDVLEKKEP